MKNKLITCLFIAVSMQLSSQTMPIDSSYNKLFPLNYMILRFDSGQPLYGFFPYSNAIPPPVGVRFRYNWLKPQFPNLFDFEQAKKTFKVGFMQNNYF